jgi:hypothetical protein
MLTMTHAFSGFSVNDLAAAVDALNLGGISTTMYDDPRLHTDDKGIARGKSSGNGPDIAWFTDPAGNVLSVIAS